MPQRSRRLAFAVVSIVFASAASGHAQGQAEPPTVREYCLKVAPGKGAEYESYLKDVAVPLARARADAGDFAWFVVSRGVFPAGSSARCDYRVAYGYKGLPPEELSNEGLDAALKRAKLPLTAEQLIAKRSMLTSLVGAEIWYRIDGVEGPDLTTGSYLRFNHYQARNTDNWVKQETTYWKPLMEAWLKAGGKGGWGVYGLAMPGGDSTPYTGLTVDSFPDWNGFIRGVPVTELWPQVHPKITPTDAFAGFDQVRSIHDVEVFKVAAVVLGK
jgi:hypothetical protein